MIRHISVKKELKKLLSFAFMGSLIFVGSIYLIFREPKRPGIITTKQYIQMKKKEKENMQEVSQKIQNEIRYITNTKRGYDWIGSSNIKFRDEKIDPYPNYDQLKWLNPGKEIYSNVKTKKH